MAEPPSSSRVSADMQGHHLEPAPAPRSVLLLTPAWARDGGIAAHVRASAQALAEHGLEVNVLAQRIAGGEDVAGVNILCSEDLVNRNAPIRTRLGDALSLAPEVIHLHQLDDPAMVTALRELAPVVISAHGYTACSSDLHYFRPGTECTRAHGPGCIHNLALRGCAHRRDPRSLPDAYRRTSRSVQALRGADLAVSYSSAIDRHLAANAVERRTVIPLFSTMAPSADGIHETSRRVLFAGRVVAPKGVEVLIHAAALLEAEVVICGDGWQLERMRKLARRLGLQDRVVFKGWLTADELARELAEASVLALPSVWPEPFGLIGIEAHAAGRPVVASATGGVTDWLQDGDNGLLVRPGDAEDLARGLAELLADPKRRQAMGEAGRSSVAARFSKQRHVEAILAAYRRARLSWQQGGAADVPAAQAASALPMP